MVLKTSRFALYTALAFFLSACSNDETYSGFDSSVTLATPDKYLSFFNQQAQLPSGSYTLVAATAMPNQSGSFDFQITRNDGSDVELLSGSWSDSTGMTATPIDSCSGAPANVCFEIQIEQATGVEIILSSSLDSVIYLLDDSDTPQLIAEQNKKLLGESETLTFSPALNQSDFATAYYQAVDPANARDTLQKYKQLHGFDTQGEDVHVIFRDSKDLGYGRDMFMRSYPNVDCGGQVTVFYVKNFSVEILDGLAYGPVNLAGAVEQDLQYHFGTNAIEFSRGLSSAGDTCSAVPFAKFYTYRSDYSTSDAPHPRIERIDLDGRGAKAMPQPCITCHGGEIQPLDRFGRIVLSHANDTVEQVGDTKARLQSFEVDTFEFSEKAGFTRAESEERLRQLNSAIYCTYPGSLGHAACADFGGGLAAETDNGEWNGDFVREVLLGWYNNQLEVTGTPYDGRFIPAGWVASVGGAPEGADALFEKVIGPNCFVCHGRRGNNLGSESNASNAGKDLDFSSWDKFISHASDIKRLVFDEGRMPLSRLNFDDFWGDPEKAALLGSFIAPHVENFAADHVDAAGNIIMPGKALARAGLDRVTQPNASIMLTAQGSLFSDSYRWGVLTSPDGAAVVLTQPSQSITDFSADIDGLYEIQLTVSATASNAQNVDTLLVLVDSGLAKAPRSLTFYDDVKAELNSCAVSCHSVAGGITPSAQGVPVWWVDDILQPQGIPFTESDTPSLGFYESVRARINLAVIEESPLLKKPSNIFHFGGLRSGFDDTKPVGHVGRDAYDLFVNWAYEGVVCGGDATQCPVIPSQ